MAVGDAPAETAPLLLVRLLFEGGVATSKVRPMLRRAAAGGEPTVGEGELGAPRDALVENVCAVEGDRRRLAVHQPVRARHEERGAGYRRDHVQHENDDKYRKWGGDWWRNARASGYWKGQPTKRELRIPPSPTATACPGIDSLSSSSLADFILLHLRSRSQELA